MQPHRTNFKITKFKELWHNLSFAIDNFGRTAYPKRKFSKRKPRKLLQIVKFNYDNKKESANREKGTEETQKTVTENEANCQRHQCPYLLPMRPV